MRRRNCHQRTPTTWNPVTGCTPASPGCANCYARRIALRLEREGQPRYRRGFEVTLHADLVDQPLRWRSPRSVFVCSMADLFHADVPDHFLRGVFDVMRRCAHHQFMLLTKRAGRLASFARAEEGLAGSWPSNVWPGVSVESSEEIWRIDYLRTVPAAVRVVNFEPLLGPVGELDLAGIQWCTVSGETGPVARAVRPVWVRQIRDRCRASGVPFAFHGWGDGNPALLGRELDGRVWDERPESTCQEQLSFFSV